MKTHTGSCTKQCGHKLDFGHEFIQFMQEGINRLREERNGLRTLLTRAMMDPPERPEPEIAAKPAVEARPEAPTASQLGIKELS